MKIVWEVTDDDAARIREVCQKLAGTKMVRDRRRKNLATHRPPPARGRIWRKLVTCLLTTQQKSGPRSPVARLASAKPFLISYRECKRQKQLRPFVLQRLTGFGGIRRTKTIAREVAQNWRVLEDGLWGDLIQLLHGLAGRTDAESERRAANFIRKHLAGFGPKQSRNLLQMLRLSRYEVPVDSRLTKRLNEFGFPLELNAANLADESYHALVNDGIQALCRKAGIYPCILDAALFTSFDQKP